MVRSFRVTHDANTLPRCFSPKRERGKSPCDTNATISTTTWCSLRIASTMTGTRDARKAFLVTSTTTTTRPPAWKTALPLRVSRRPQCGTSESETYHPPGMMLRWDFSTEISMSIGKWLRPLTSNVSPMLPRTKSTCISTDWPPGPIGRVTV
jgi:hypothetical protein